MIITKTRTAYRAPAAGRDYLTKRAAIHAEARALIKRKHPTVNGDDSDGPEHWTEIQRANVLWRRVVRMVRNGLWADEGVV